MDSLTIQIPVEKNPWREPAAPTPKAAAGGGGAAHLKIQIPPNEEHIQSLLTQSQELVRAQKKIADKILSTKDKGKKILLEVELVALEAEEEAVQKELTWLLMSAKYGRPTSPVFKVIDYENKRVRKALDKEIEEIISCDKFLLLKDTFDPVTHSLLKEANEERYKSLCKKEKVWHTRPIVNCIYCELDGEWCSDDCKKDAAIWVKQLKND